MIPATTTIPAIQKSLGKPMPFPARYFVAHDAPTDFNRKETQDRSPQLELGTAAAYAGWERKTAIAAAPQKLRSDANEETQGAAQVFQGRSFVLRETL